MLISSHVIICTLLCWLVISNRQNSRIQSTNDNWIAWSLLFKQWSLKWWMNGVHYNKSISFSFPLYITPGNTLNPFQDGLWDLRRYTCKTHNSTGIPPQHPYPSSHPVVFMFPLEFPELTGASGLEGAFEIVCACFIGKATETEVVKCIAQGSNRKGEEGSGLKSGSQWKISLGKS